MMKLGLTVSVTVALLSNAWCKGICANEERDWLVVTPSSLMNEKINKVAAAVFKELQQSGVNYEKHTIRAATYGDKTPEALCAKMLLNATKLTDTIVTDYNTYKTDVIDGYSRAGFDGIVRPMMAASQSELVEKNKIILYFYEVASKMSQIGIKLRVKTPNDHCTGTNYTSHNELLEWLPYDSVIVPIRMTYNEHCTDMSEEAQQFSDLMKLGVDVRPIELNPDVKPEISARMILEELEKVCPEDKLNFVDILSSTGYCEDVDWTIVYPVSLESFYWASNVARSIAKLAEGFNATNSWRMAGVSYINKPQFSKEGYTYCAKVNHKMEKVSSFDYWKVQEYVIHNSDETKKSSGVDGILRVVLSKEVGRDAEKTGIIVYIHDTASHVAGDSGLPSLTVSDFKYIEYDINYGCSDKDFASIAEIGANWPNPRDYLLQIRVGEAKVSDDYCLLPDLNGETFHNGGSITIKHDARTTIEKELYAALQKYCNFS